MADKPYPFTEEQEAWLRDLETTDAPQAKGFLHWLGDEDGQMSGYCCLGRACVIFNVPGAIDKQSNCETFEGFDGVVPESIVDLLCLQDEEGRFDSPAYVNSRSVCSLAGLNDDGMTFKQIAAYIRANPWNVFRDPKDSPNES